MRKLRHAVMSLPQEYKAGQDSFIHAMCNTLNAHAWSPWAAGSQSTRIMALSKESCYRVCCVVCTPAGVPTLKPTGVPPVTPAPAREVTIVMLLPHEVKEMARKCET